MDGFPVPVNGFGCVGQPFCITHWYTCVCISAPCVGSAFFCHSNMCINTSLVCNGIQNCVFPWDESNCKGTLVVPQHFVIFSLKLCCAVLYCNDLHYVIWCVPCLALLCHIEPPWESAAIMLQDFCNRILTQPPFFSPFSHVFYVIFYPDTTEKFILVNVGQYRISLRNFLLAGKQWSCHL